MDEQKQFIINEEEEKVLQKFSDEDLYNYMAKRRLDNVMPKIRRQIQIMNKMEELAEQLTECEIDNPEYRNGLEIIQIQDHVERYLKTLNNMKQRARNGGL